MISRDQWFRVVAIPAWHKATEVIAHSLNSSFAFRVKNPRSTAGYKFGESLQSSQIAMIGIRALLLVPSRCQWLLLIGDENVTYSCQSSTCTLHTLSVYPRTNRGTGLSSTSSSSKLKPLSSACFLLSSAVLFLPILMDVISDTRKVRHLPWAGCRKETGVRYKWRKSLVVSLCERCKTGKTLGNEKEQNWAQDGNWVLFQMARELIWAMVG